VPRRRTLTRFHSRHAVGAKLFIAATRASLFSPPPLAPNDPKGKGLAGRANYITTSKLHRVAESKKKLIWR